MEIACNIITKKKNKMSIDLDVINNFRDLNISGKLEVLSAKAFLSIIKSKIYISTSTKFANLFLNCNDGDIGKSILMAYYISNYSDDIFKPIKTSNDIKLINAANIMLYYLEEIDIHDIQTDFPNDKLIDSIDYYYSLYKMWISDKKINEISNLICKFSTIIDTCFIKKNNNECIKKCMKQIKNTIKKMFYINTCFATKALLNNYDIFYLNKYICAIVWDYIKSKSKDNIHTILIILAEIRVKLLKVIKAPNDKRFLYYNIDIDSIINKIRNNNFMVYDFNNILNIILKILNDNGKTIDYPKSIKDFSKESTNIIFDEFKQIFEVTFSIK
jgi:hypothetical protein